MSGTWTETRTWTDPATDDEHEVEVEFAWVDNGIGPYEFWGARGNDVDFSAEVESVTLDGRDITGTLDDSVLSAWAESAEPPEDEYEADDDRD